MNGATGSADGQGNDGQRYDDEVFDPDTRADALIAIRRALEEDLRYGPDATSLATVPADAPAETAGTTKKTLYDRFGSKDALVALYLLRRAHRWRAHRAHPHRHWLRPDGQRALRWCGRARTTPRCRAGPA